MEKRFYNEMLGFLLKIGTKLDVTLSLNESSVSRLEFGFYVNYEWEWMELLSGKTLPKIDEENHKLAVRPVERQAYAQ